MTLATPLLAEHQKLGATIVPFAGWSMPLHYGSQLKEHEAVRTSVGMFDVSHMTIIDLLGPGARDFLRYMLANDIDKLKHPGQAQYNCLLNDHGGIIDDVIIYFMDVERYRMISNAATRDKVLPWLNRYAQDFSVGIQEHQDLGIIAIQGKDALASITPLLTAAQHDLAATIAPFEFAHVGHFFIARTGYTGEDGYEWILPHKMLVETWHKLIAAGVPACGLGARDTLRLEAGYNLSGQDMDENTTPYESRMSWVVALEPKTREFIGRAALEIQKSQGVKRELVGLILDAPGVLRSHMKIFTDTHQIGEITSGSFSPCLQQGIALTRLNTPVPDELTVEIRGQKLPCHVVKPPFIRK